MKSAKPASQHHSRWATRSSLIMDLKGVSQERWEEFLFLYEPLLLAWMRKKNVPESEADDILQESWNAIHKGIGNFERGENKGTFRGWLRTIVERKAADYFRKRKRNLVKVEAEEILNSTEAPAQKSAGEIDEEEIALQEVRARALELVRRKTEKSTWDMFWQSSVEERPTKEIAAEFGVTTAAVRVNKQRVIKRLKEAMIDSWSD